MTTINILQIYKWVYYIHIYIYKIFIFKVFLLTLYFILSLCVIFSISPGEKSTEITTTQ